MSSGYYPSSSGYFPPGYSSSDCNSSSYQPPVYPSSSSSCYATCTSSGYDSSSGYYSNYPVRYHDGKIGMNVKDIEMQGKAVKLTHQRKYDNLKLVSKDGPNGFGWEINRLPKIQWHPNVYYRAEFSKHDKVNFALESDKSGIHAALDEFPDTMRCDDKEKTIIVTRRNNAVWSFNNDPDGDCPLGAAISVEHPNGTKAIFIYQEKRLVKVQEYAASTPEQILLELAYDYTNDGHIASITLSQWNGKVTAPSKRMVYSYYTENDSNGNHGDLKCATSELAFNAIWIPDGTYYYRYYKTDQEKGKQHALKMAFFP